MRVVARCMPVLSSSQDHSLVGRKHPLVLDLSGVSGSWPHILAAPLGFHSNMDRTHCCLRAFWTTYEDSRSLVEGQQI